jgi:hypothetical protein
MMSDKTMWDYYSKFEDAMGGESEGLQAIFEVVDQKLGAMARTQLHQAMDRYLEECAAEEAEAMEDAENLQVELEQFPAISGYTVEQILRANGIGPDPQDSDDPMGGTAIDGNA